MIPLQKIKEISTARQSNTAIISEGETVSWDEFAHTVDKIVNSLDKIQQLEEVDTICFISPNRIELIYLAAAATTLKIPFIGLDYSLETDALKNMMSEAKCSLLVTSSSFCVESGINLSQLANGRPLIDMDNVLRSAIAYSSLDDGDISSMSSTYATERPFKSISFTSGTSGLPKTVLRFQSFDARRFSYFTTRYGFNAQDRHLLAIPLYHAAGIGWARLFLQLGATLIIAPYDNPEQLAKIIRNEWITTSVLTPPLLMNLLDYAKSNNVDLMPNSLRFLLVGGKHFPVQAKQHALKTLGPIVYEYYGTTETGVNTIAEPNDLLENPETVGRVYDGNEIKILDTADNSLAADCVGRIAISSYMNMDTYQNAEAEKVLIDGKRFLLTPETGYYDQEGYLYLMNRSQGSTSLNFFEMENQINRLPCVEDVAVVAKNGSRSEVECALVIRAESKINLPIIREKVIGLIKKHRGKACNIGILERIPYSPSGKVRAVQIIEALHSNSESDSKNISDSSNNTFSRFLLGIVCLIATTIAWGAMFPIAKNALVSLDAVHITLIRYGLASIILMLILWLREGSSALWPGKNTLKLLLFGSLGFAGFSILAFAGLAHTKAQHGAIIMALMPLISVLMIWLLQGSKPRAFTLGSIVLALVGVTLVVTQGDISSLAGGTLIPSLVILAGATCWVIYTLGNSYITGFSVLRYTALSAALGTLTIIAVAVFSNTIGWTSPPSLEQLSQIGWELTYLVIIAGVMAVFSWNTGVKILGPINSVLFINLVPVTAFIIGYFQGNIFSNAEVIGTTITIAALLMNNFYLRGWIFKPQQKLQLKTA